MTNYESMDNLLHFLNYVKNFPKTQWSNISDWEMEFCMHQLVVKNKTKSSIGGVRFISLSCDEMTTFD